MLEQLLNADDILAVNSLLDIIRQENNQLNLKKKDAISFLIPFSLSIFHFPIFRIM